MLGICILLYYFASNKRNVNDETKTILVRIHLYV